MTYTIYERELGAFLGLSTDYAREKNEFEQVSGLIHVLWNRGVEPGSVLIDNTRVTLLPGQLTTTTYVQVVEFDKGSPPLTAFSFNREFYCINTHDDEVSCNGIIFFGTPTIPVVTLDATETPKFDMLFSVFVDEFLTRDNIQGEMLRMLLKRLIIKVTRLARQQLITLEPDNQQVDIVRKFNLLVDTHFRTHKQVADYAGMLFKSPKTLANLFAKLNRQSPLTVIHERIVLEARRQLLYTDKSAKEIAHDLGFEEVATFHKLFKKMTGITPLQFKQNSATSVKGKNGQLVGKS